MLRYVLPFRVDTFRFISFAPRLLMDYRLTVYGSIALHYCFHFTTFIHSCLHNYLSFSKKKNPGGLILYRVFVHGFLFACGRCESWGTRTGFHAASFSFLNSHPSLKLIRLHIYFPPVDYGRTYIMPKIIKANRETMNNV
jgi:hypothetical protein